MIEEYVPIDYVGTCIAIYTFAQNLGILLSALMALILPNDDNKKALDDNKSWRIMFGLPFILYLLMLIGFQFFIPFDSPKYYMASNNSKEAMQSIHRIYKTEGSDRVAKTIFHQLENENTGDTSDVTLR